MYPTDMSSQQDIPISEKNLHAAMAVVDAAILGAHDNSKVRLHPKLKKIIALEIAKQPSLTSDLFSPDFFSKFLEKILEGNSP